MIYFRSKRTEIPSSNIKLNGVKIFGTNKVKYVGIIFDEHLTFQRHIKLLNAKLKRANNLIAISRHYLRKKFLMQIYYSQFYSHLTYGCQLWGQNETSIEKTIILQQKAIRLISFANFKDSSNILFKELNLLKPLDIIQKSNILFTHSAINKKIPIVLKVYFTLNVTELQLDTIKNLNSVFSLPVGSL